MEEARIGKKIDSDSEKPNYLKILIDYSHREYPKYYKREIWIDLATHFVPQEILDCAVSFSRNMMGYTPPLELQERFPPNYPNSLIEIEWNSVIKEWIIEFMMDLEKSQSLTDSQGTNVYENLKKAIALYVQKFRGDDDNYDNEVIEELDFYYNYFIAEAKNSKFPADDIWSYTFNANGSAGDLDFCLGQLYNYITAEIDSNYSLWNLEMMEEHLEVLYLKKMREVRQQCLESGSADGQNWSITHQSLW